VSSQNTIDNAGGGERTADALHQFISFAIGDDQYGVVALIDLPHLLTVSMADGASPASGTHHAAA
jgi:hypothetical protein